MRRPGRGVGSHAWEAYGAIGGFVATAVAKGRISKDSRCCQCGCVHHRLHGHHDDYTKPLEVRWLCPSCHALVHRYDTPETDRGITAMAVYLASVSIPHVPASNQARLRAWVQAGNNMPSAAVVQP